MTKVIKLNESDIKRIVKRVLNEQEEQTYTLLDTEWENNVPERVKVLSNQGFNDIEDKDAVEIMKCEGSVNRLPNLNAFPNLILVNLLGCQPLIDIHVDSLIDSDIARVLFNYVDTPTMNHKVNELIKRGEEKGMSVNANKVDFYDVPDGMLDGEALPAGAPLDEQRVITEQPKQQLPTSPCRKLRGKEIVVVYSDSPYIGPQDIVGTYTLPSASGKGGFVPRELNKKNAFDLDLQMQLEDEGYLKDLVKSKYKPKWGLYAFKDELKSSTTRLSNITSSEEIKRMIFNCRNAQRGIPDRQRAGGYLK